MEKLKIFLRKKLEKVNTQVSLLTCMLVVFSCLIIYFVTSGVMISILTDAYDARANLTFETIESHLDDRLYGNYISDGAYTSVMSYLTAMKESMDISEIFIAKRKNNGEIVYLLDTENDEVGLDMRKYQVTGKVRECIDDMYVLSIVHSGKFFNMPDGYRYMNFYPVFENSNSVKGVVCIAIDADNVHTARIILYVLVGLILILCCIISVRFSNKIFRKISNPLYQDASNTDNLTGLKNKNSFSVDMHNIEEGNTGRYGIITIDLNGLKHINDTRGHQAGDMYIQRASKILKAAMAGTDFVGYRVGGDEFSIISKDKSLEEINDMVLLIEKKTEESNVNNGMILTMSIGFAKFDKDRDRNFSMTIERSDAMMYENKRQYYKKKNQG